MGAIVAIAMSGGSSRIGAQAAAVGLVERSPQTTTASAGGQRAFCALSLASSESLRCDSMVEMKKNM